MEINPEDGPVLVTVEYEIVPEEVEAFKKTIYELEHTRRRDGAFQWGLFNDSANHRRFVETYLVNSWAEHLRQHQRLTIADRKLEERVYRFHKGQIRPKVSHLIYSDVHPHSRFFDWTRT